MTPEEFKERNPNWRQHASDMCATVVTKMIRERAIPTPWTAEALEQLAQRASEMTVEVFSPYRDQMGDEIFGQLVDLIGQEAKYYAVVARAGDETDVLQ